MYNRLFYIIISAFFLIACNLTHAESKAAPHPIPATAALPIPKPPTSGAKAFVIQDYDSGRVIAAENPDEQYEPASITKLMTAYVIFNELKSGHIQLSDQVTISEKAWRTPGSRMFVEVGKQVAVEDLMQGMIVQSGNDATVALAEYLAGSEETFAALMNRTAEEMGLTGSHFVNSTGLPDENHYMTAHDIARLATRVIRDHPNYYKWYSQKQYTFNDITQYNRNKLLWRDETVDGVKTGFTDSAGYCLVTSARRDGMRLITVVLGTASANSRIEASAALLNYGFRFFETHKLYDAGTTLASSRVWKGGTDSVPLGLDRILYVTIPRGQYESLDASMRINNQIMAPLEAGTALGSVQVKLGEEVVAEQPLVSLQAIAEGSFWQRIIDEALLYLE
jgi:D-alanyl-D-alanine carboxypeptidase (penicillin-binding protein 5/6)